MVAPRNFNAVRNHPRALEGGFPVPRTWPVLDHRLGMPCYPVRVRILVAMSGGVDSSVAAAILLEEGHDVTGVTLKLWDGAATSGAHPGVAGRGSGCCSAADAADARRVASALGIDHYVFGDTEDFAEFVVDPYVRAHAVGLTPNPCVECNRHVKFGLLLERARRLGFDALATGHHARVVATPRGLRVARGADRLKDQSYVLSTLGQEVLEEVLFPVGTLTKAEVRARAAGAGLEVACKPDSQDVCFVAPGAGRARFLAERIDLRPGTLVEAASGEVVGSVEALELVTVGQRRGLGSSRDAKRRYALKVDTASRMVLVGDATMALSAELPISDLTWTSHPGGEVLASGGSVRVLAQASAHGQAQLGVVVDGEVRYDMPQRLVAPGQIVAFYDPERPDEVIGAAVSSGSRVATR